MGQQSVISATINQGPWRIQKGLNSKLRVASTAEYSVELEHALKSLGIPEDTTGELRPIVVPNMLRARLFNALSDMEHKALCTLKKDKNKVILLADRGWMKVIVDTINYIEGTWTDDATSAGDETFAT